MRRTSPLAALLVALITIPLGHADPASAPLESPVGVVHRDLAYVPAGHERQKLDLYLPEQEGPLEPFPVLVWIHGGAWRSGTKEDDVPAAYVHDGYAVASVGYRLSQHAPFPAQLEDVKAAVRWLRAHADEYGLNADQIAAWGASAGGHLAALLGTTGELDTFDVGPHLSHSSRVQAVVDYYGPTDFLQMDAQRIPGSMEHNPPDSPESELIGGPIQTLPLKTARANPVTYVSPGDPPFLIIHGDLDRLVPYQQSLLLEYALEQAGVPVELYLVKGAGHGGFEDPKVVALTRTFLREHLKLEP